MIAALFLVGTGAWPFEQPRVEAYVQDLMGCSEPDTIYDGALGRVRIPTGPLRRATFTRLGDGGWDERTCEFTFDDRSRVVQWDHWAPFNFGLESETIYEYGLCGLRSRSTRNVNASHIEETFRAVYDDKCILIGTERRTHNGEWVRSVRFDGVAPREIVILTSTNDPYGPCEDEVHHVFADENGGLWKHVVDRANSSLVRYEFHLDERGQVEQYEHTFPSNGFRFTAVIERLPDRTTVARYGTYGEVIDTEDRLPFVGGEIIERFDVGNQQWSTQTLDQHALSVRLMWGTGTKVTDSMRFENIYDRHGNLVEWHRTTLPEGRSKSEFYGYRFDIEYSQPK